MPAPSQRPAPCKGFTGLLRGRTERPDVPLLTVKALVRAEGVRRLTATPMARRLVLVTGRYHPLVSPRNIERRQAHARALRALRALRISARGLKDLDRRDVLVDQARRLYAELQHQQTAEHFNNIANRAEALLQLVNGSPVEVLG